MHGLIHVVLKQFVLTQHGGEVWDAVLKKLDLESDESILAMSQYEDKTTLAALTAAVEVLGVTLDEALQAFGSFFVRYAASQGWVRMLHSMGRNLPEFLDNVNQMHHFLERDFRSAVFPYFQVAGCKEGTLLTYTSGRHFPSLVAGMLKELGPSLFGRSVEIQEQSRTKVSTTWLIVDVGPLEVVVCTEFTQPSEVEKQITPEVCFSFQVFHEAMVSVGKFMSTGTCAQGGCAGVQHPPTTEGRDVSTQAVAKKAALIVQSTRADFDVPRDVPLVDALRDMQAESRMAMAAKLVRCVTAGRVACTWGDTHMNEGLKRVWSQGRSDPELSDWSVPCFDSARGERPYQFVSHSWQTPQNWDVMMPECLYEELKATELCLCAKDLAQEEFRDSLRWAEVNLWIDKLCIHQDNRELLDCSISLIEEFLMLSDGLVVLFSWSYLTRLWCVYEWACFLVFHDPVNVKVAADLVFRDWTQDQFVKSVREFKVQDCECKNQQDHAILYGKIQEYYRSVQDFERFLKFTVIALLARCIAQRGQRTSKGLTCWADLADDCGFDKLAEVLRAADPVAWGLKALAGRQRHVSMDLQETLTRSCEQWFAEKVVPLINEERTKAASDQLNDIVSAKRNVMTRVRSQTDSVPDVQSSTVFLESF